MRERRERDVFANKSLLLSESLLERDRESILENMCLERESASKTTSGDELMMLKALWAHPKKKSWI